MKDTPCTDFSRPVEELQYSCLLKNTFTQDSHDRGFKTWQTPVTYPESLFCGRKYRWGSVYVECHMDPNISKTTIVKERVVPECAESQSTLRDPNRTRFLTVQVVIRDKFQCDKKVLMTEVDVSIKRNVMLVGGNEDNVVDLCEEDTMTKPPNRPEFEECWSETIINEVHICHWPFYNRLQGREKSHHVWRLLGHFETRHTGPRCWSPHLSLWDIVPRGHFGPYRSRKIRPRRRSSLSRMDGGPRLLLSTLSQTDSLTKLGNTRRQRKRERNNWYLFYV